MPPSPPNINGTTGGYAGRRRDRRIACCHELWRVRRLLAVAMPTARYRVEGAELEARQRLQAARGLLRGPTYQLMYWTLCEPPAVRPSLTGEPATCVTAAWQILSGLDTQGLGLRAADRGDIKQARGLVGQALAYYAPELAPPPPPPTPAELARQARAARDEKDAAAWLRRQGAEAGSC